MVGGNTVYLRGRGFDSFFIGFIPLLAIVSAALAYMRPDLFEVIILADLALLGYHHVIATYTRIAFDKKSMLENRALIFYLPPLVILAVVGLALANQEWLIATVYLHWQWYHYTRQSEGVAKSIRFKSKSSEAGSEKFNRFVFYFIPIVTFLAMSSRQPTTFLFMKVYTLPVPVLPANIFLGLGVAVLLVWFLYQLQGLKANKTKFGHVAYLLSHHLIYFVAYVLFEDITIGWLAINIWHNLQYIAFVWHANVNKFKSGFDSAQPIISWLSQPKRVFYYAGFCLIVTYAFYSLIDFGIQNIEPYTSLPLVVIAYQAVNFHHYIVDSLIWKLRKPEVRKVLEI